MELLSWIIQNKEFVKLFYAFVIVLICAVITIKSDKFYKLSLHQGIRYFRNAFFFYGLAFLTRYFIIIPGYNFITKAIFELFFVMAGFFLLYSLVWKKIEAPSEDYFSSLFNMKIFIFYIMTFIIICLDYLWNNYVFLFASQIIVFIFAFAISLQNYREKGQNRKFLKYYSIAMLLALTAWILNALAGLLFDWSQGILITTYLFNTIMFLLFLFGIIKVTKN